MTRRNAIWGAGRGGLAGALMLLATTTARAQTVNPDTMPIQPENRFKRRGGGVSVVGLAPALLQALAVYAQVKTQEHNRRDGWQALGAATCLLLRREDGEPVIVVLRESGAHPNCTVRTNR